MNPKIRQVILPLLAAMIWGLALVAQNVGNGYIGPMTFSACRSLIAFVSLLMVLYGFRALRKTHPDRFPAPPGSHRDLVLACVSCGTALAIATNLQQAGLSYTTTGKAGFITALYIVLVPLFGLFLRKSVTLPVWAGVALAVAGLYFLCIKEQFTVTYGDFLVLLCAAAFAVQILLIDHFSKKVDGVALSCGQFLVVSIWSAIGMFLFEEPRLSAILACMVPLLYVGVLSSGVGYTLQILAQKDGNPTLVTLLMSMESVFATLAGAAILHETMSAREYIGCGLMLCAVILAQIPMPAKKTEKIAVQ